jgi:hypothetical protein
MAGVGPVAELRHGASFLGGLRPFLRGATDLPGYARRLEEELADREQTFASTLERAVFGNPGSPYRALFDWAGITAGDVAAELRSHGLDATLARLHDAGVRVTLDEFKGLRPIERPGLSLAVRAADFDNPAAGRRYRARTGGSSGRPRRLLVKLDLLEHEAAYHALLYAAAGVADRPMALWHPAPPGAVGIKTALIQAKLGRPVARWFSQGPERGASRHALFTRATTAATALYGARIPAPEHTPTQAAGRVADWLAGQTVRVEHHPDDAVPAPGVSDEQDEALDTGQVAPVPDAHSRAEDVEQPFVREVAGGDAHDRRS